MRPFSASLAPLLLVIAMVRPVQAEDAFLSLRSQALVDGTVVMLGDIAEVTAREPAVAARLRNIELSRVPSLAKPLRLGRSDIDARLAQQGALPSGGIVWGGATEVTVAGRPRHLDLGPGIDAAATMLMQELGTGYAVVLRVVDAGGEVLAPPGRTSIRPEPGAAFRVGSTVDVPLLVEVEGVLVARPTVRFEIRRSLLESTQAESVTYRSAADSAPAPDTRAATSHKSVAAASRSVPAVPDNLLVEKDQSVRFLIDAGSVRLEGEGVALADARLGDLVKVRRASGGAEILGRVSSSGMILVEER